MEIRKLTTIELSEDEVKQIISDYLHKKGFNVPSNEITLAVGSRLEGDDYLSEHEVLYFKGCYAHVQE